MKRVRMEFFKNSPDFIKRTTSVGTYIKSLNHMYVIVGN